MEILQLTNKSISAVKDFLLKDFLSIIQKGSSVFLANIVDRLSSIIVFWLIAKVYGAASYGQIVTAFTVCGLIDVILQMGIPIFIQREAARNNSFIREYIYRALNLRVITFLFFILAITVYYLLFPSSGIPVITMGIIVIAVFINSISQVFVSYYYGLSKNHFVLKGVFISRVFFIGASLFVIWNGFPVEYLLFLFAAAYSYQLFLFSGNFKFRNAEIKLILKKRDPDFTKKIRNECVPLVISAALVTFYDRIDVLIISGINSFSSVAYYNIAYNIYKLPLIGFSLLFTPLFTAFSGKYYRCSLEYREILKLGFVVFLIALIISVCLYTLSDFIIIIIYGTEYSGASGVLKYLSFAFVFLVLNNYTNLLVNSMNLNRENIKIFVLSLFINIILNIILVSSTGINGAAIATILTELLVLSLQSVLIRNHLTKYYSR